MIEPIYPDRWIEQHAGAIFRTCRRITSSEDTAWEAFQETCLAFAKRRDNLDLTRDLEPWLKETARRCSRAIVRRETRRGRWQAEETLDSVPAEHVTQIDAASLRESVAALQEELQLLPQEDRDLLQCLYVKGMSHLSTAEQLQCSAGSVHARAERVRGQLRRRMQRRGITVGMLLLLFLLNQQAEASSPRLIAAPLKPRLLKLAAAAALSLVGAVSLQTTGRPTAAPPQAAPNVAEEKWVLREFHEETVCEIPVTFGYETADNDLSAIEQQVIAGGLAGGIARADDQL